MGGAVDGCKQKSMGGHDVQASRKRSTRAARLCDVAAPRVQGFCGLLAPRERCTQALAETHSGMSKQAEERSSYNSQVLGSSEKRDTRKKTLPGVSSDSWWPQAREMI